MSHIENEAQNMKNKYCFSTVTPLTLDCLNEKAKLGDLVKSHDLVISLLPYIFHPQVCEIAIEHQTNMVTASYLSDGMAALDEKVFKRSDYQYIRPENKAQSQMLIK